MTDQEARLESRLIIDSMIGQGKICDKIFWLYARKGVLDWAKGYSPGHNLIGVPTYALPSAHKGYEFGYYGHKKGLYQWAQVQKGRKLTHKEIEEVLV